jgi:hypothetical protein
MKTRLALAAVLFLLAGCWLLAHAYVIVRLGSALGVLSFLVLVFLLFLYFRRLL